MLFEYQSDHNEAEAYPNICRTKGVSCSNLTYLNVKKYGFFSTHLTMVPKTTPKGTFETQKNIYFPKINQYRVAKNVFDLQNDFHEDRLSFRVYGEKINLGNFRLLGI